MPKINPSKKIQKRRTEQEMRNALASFAGQQPATDVDDAGVVLSDCIEELLESRQLIEEIKQFVWFWSTKFQRK